jgi:putative acetyltransferase
MIIPAFRCADDRPDLTDTAVEYRIRPIRKEDDPGVSSVLRRVMAEFGAVGSGYSSEDPEVEAMFEAYPAPAAAFFVVERQGRILGCGGMGPLAGTEPGTCELRKMYFLPELRGAGAGSRLLQLILDAAREAGYRRCYLETLGSMRQARRLYRAFGFAEVPDRLGDTGHSGCTAWMVKDLQGQPPGRPVSR